VEVALVAGVKAKRNGAAKAPVWTVTDCTECGKVIDYTDPKRIVFPAQRVLVIAESGRRFEWRHKACVK
jgi:hypothetical protein